MIQCKNRVFKFIEKLLNSELNEKDNEIIELGSLYLMTSYKNIYCIVIKNDFEVTLAHSDICS